MSLSKILVAESMAPDSTPTTEMSTLNDLYICSFFTFILMLACC